MTSAKPRCFVISPIGDKGSIERRHADMVLHSVIEQALPDYDVKRADAFGAAEMISDKIIEAITTHDLAIADLTFSNPNVFYELGLRHMAEKPVIHIAGDGTKLPFDNSGVSTIFFDVTDIHSHKQARDEIAKAAAVVMTKGYKVSNPVTQARGSMKLANSADSKDQMIANMMDRIEKLERFPQYVTDAMKNARPRSTNLPGKEALIGAQNFAQAAQSLRKPNAFAIEMDEIYKQGLIEAARKVTDKS